MGKDPRRRLDQAPLALETIFCVTTRMSRERFAGAKGGTHNLRQRGSRLVEFQADVGSPISCESCDGSGISEQLVSARVGEIVKELDIFRGV